MTGLSYNLLMNLLLGQPVSRPVREEGNGNGLATVVIWTSELYIGSLLVAIILHLLHNEVHLTQ